MIEEETEEVSMQRLQHAGLHQSLQPSVEEAANVEDLLADEMSKLSVLEHDKVSFDIHGIAAEIEETEELIQQSLPKLEEELQKIKKKSSYEKALGMDPKYVTSRSFRLRFLRCEDFNCKHAASRLVLHFEQKEILFGSAGDILIRDVRLSDMDATTLEVFKSGPAQILPTRDVSGRAVIALFSSRFSDDMNVKGVSRLLYYLVQCAMQDEILAQKAVVFVLYFVGKKTRPPSLELVKSIHRFRMAVPHKLQAMHLCSDNKKWRPFISGFRLFLTKRARTRCRVHFGDEQQVLFQLQTYGVPIPEDSPLRTVDGDFTLKWQEEWIRIRQAQEQKQVEGTDRGISIPHRFDVLFGRGSTTRMHTGNLRALHLVNMRQTRYDAAANRFEKAAISEQIVSIVHQSNGRFLKWSEPEGWVEVDDKIARDKVSHWFRTNREKTAKSSNKETKASKRNRSSTESNDKAKK